MSLHGLLAVIIGVPNVHETAAYSARFGQLLRVLQRHGRHHRRPPVDAEELEGARGLFAWGPPPPSFLHPEDLAAMMTGAHSAR